jgi:hypothetical protein
VGDLLACATRLEQPPVDELDVTHRLDSLANVVEQSTGKVDEVWGVRPVDR